ncbi:MAG TPA: HepT-like ribonuclease domain-containing protein [Candidatus Paceibacterota bacterium]
MIDTQLIQQKTADIKGYLSELDPLLKEESRKIIDDNLKLRSVERLFQLIVDTAIDINTHIITRSGFPVPEDYYSTFTELGKNKVLEMYFAQKIGDQDYRRKRIFEND